MFELTWNGKNPITLDDGKTRTWLNDNDTVKFVGYSKGNGYTVGFGDCEGTLLPSYK
jgi:fumarylacetoacetase